MESHPAVQHDGNRLRVAGSLEGRTGRHLPIASLAGGLGALADVEAPTAVDGPCAYFAEVSRARNGALDLANQSSRMPRCESNDGVRNLELRRQRTENAPLTFTASDRSMVFCVFASELLVQVKPPVLNWRVLLGTDYLRDVRGRVRKFGSMKTALAAAVKAERVCDGVHESKGTA